MTLGIAAHQFYVLRISNGHLSLILRVFVFLKELGELLVIKELLLFNRYNSANVLFEIFQVVHQNLLFFDEVVDVGGVLGQNPLFLIWTRNSNVFIVKRQNSVGVCAGEAFEGVFHFALRPQKYLQLGCFGEVVGCAYFEEELV